MKNFIKILVFAFLLIVTAIVFFTGIKRTTNQPVFEKQELGKESTNFANQYFIDNMRKREFKGGEVEIEKTVGNSGKFTSYIVSYPSDNLKIFALMNLPNGKKPVDGFPVVIVNHGFINPDNYSTENSYRKIADFYATAGFLVLKPDYRGHANSEGEGGGALSRIEYAADVLNLISSISTIPEAAPDKIFLYGHSMGGDVALRVLEITDRVKATSLWAPATTYFPESLLYFVRRHRPEMLQTFEEEIAKVFDSGNFPKLSPINNTRLIKTPVIIHHGTDDASVPYNWSVELDKKLTETGVTHTFYTYQNEDHNFTQGSWSTAVMRDLDLFKKFF